MSGDPMPRWRWMLIQGILFLAAGLVFCVSLVFGSPGWWVGVAGVASFVVATTALFLGWRERRRMLAAEAEEALRRRRKGG